MNFQIFGSEKAPTLLLIPGLGVSYEIFLPVEVQYSGYIFSKEE